MILICLAASVLLAMVCLLGRLAYFAIGLVGILVLFWQLGWLAVPVLLGAVALGAALESGK